jgi:manganese-dependent inorganic pyrophosphatase
MKIYIIGHKSPDLDAVASTIEYAELLKALNRYENAEFVPCRAGEPNKETEFVFEKFKVDIPKMLSDYVIDEEDDGFILVDHNEESQRADEVINDKVLEIIDHHKLKVNFTSPVRLDVKPVGSTSTVIYEAFEANKIEPSKDTKGLIFASILSDTQGLKSSTTTGLDSEIANELAEELNLDIQKFTFELFKAKSDISGLTPEEIAKRL